MTYDVITIGAATRDVFMRSQGIRVVRDDSFSTGEAECLPLGSKIEVDEIVFETGGGGTNTAVGFARQGLSVGYIGRIGHEDARGKEILAAMKAEGVDVRHVAKDRKRLTGYSVLLLTNRGERTVLVYRGASSDFAVSDVHKTLEAKWIYVSSLGGNLNVLKTIWAQAKKSGTKIAWNPGAKELALGLEKIKTLLAESNLVSLNQEEAAKLVGATRHQDISVFHQFRKLVGGVALLTQGTDGCLASDGQHVWHSYTRDIHVTDTTGAGDAFGSGFVGAYLRGKDIPTSMQFATANSESVIQHLGAKKGLLRATPPREPVRVEKLL